jgi:type II secretory pathway pseudopilin PulG
MTLIEILVASALFGLFTGMVAGALVLAHRAQDKSVTKLDAIRRASLALDLLVRELEAAQYDKKVSMNGAAVPANPTQPAGVNELQIRRNRAYPGSTFPDSVIAGYWFDPGTGEVGKGMVRRTLYSVYLSPLEPVEGESADGRVLVRDVKNFLISRTVAGSLTTIRADIFLSTVGSPISTTVALQPPSGAP